MESHMVGMKITRIKDIKDGRHKNSSPKGWTDGEAYGRHENNSLKGWTDGELYSRHENNSPKGWTAQK